MFSILLCFRPKKYRRENFENKKIAFLFLIYDKINNEDVWKTFFENVPKTQYDIFIHDKTYKKSEYFDKYKLNNPILTNWGDISLLLAQNLLIEEGLKDPDISHFIFLSNSCIPFKKFEHIYNKLDGSFSYFNICPHEESFPRCNPSLEMVDKKIIQKSHQWCILNRKHAEILVNDINIYRKWFEYKGTVPDEHSYITYLFYLNLQDELKITKNLPESATTYTNWRDHEFFCHPKSYDNINIDEILKLWKAHCFFGRKFNKGCKGLNKLIELLKS